MKELMKHQPCRMLQLGAGVFLRDAGLREDMSPAQLRRTLRRGLTDPDKRLGATLPGGSFTAQPLRKALGCAADLQAGDLTLVTGWQATLSGVLTECSPQALGAVLGPVRTDRQEGCTVLTPLPCGEEPLTELTWVGLTTEGLTVILLPRAMSEGGLSLTFRGDGCGTTPFRFRAMLPEEGASFSVMFLEDGDEA